MHVMTVLRLLVANWLMSRPDRISWDIFRSRWQFVAYVVVRGLRFCWRRMYPSGTVFAGVLYPRTVFAAILYPRTVFAGGLYPKTVFVDIIYPRTISCRLGQNASNQFCPRTKSVSRF